MPGFVWLTTNVGLEGSLWAVGDASGHLLAVLFPCLCFCSLCAASTALYAVEICVGVTYVRLEDGVDEISLGRGPAGVCFGESVV
jgi:hypothetical protein